ncbi:MAG: arsenate reductase ArsC [Bacteroidota bacterium]|nr:arsenate reductase ArsC [Bacteroidota bacterium]
MKNILVLCTGNSCRSQMAEGYLRLYAGDKADIYSAGIQTHGLNPKAVASMAADGVDISHHTSNLIDEYKHIDFDIVLTVCDHARENCPYFPTKAVTIHQNFSDPSKVIGTQLDIDEAFTSTRTLIKNWCQQIVSEQV